MDHYNWDWRTDENADQASEYAELMVDNLTTEELVREALIEKQFDGKLLEQLELTMKEFYRERFKNRASDDWSGED